MWDSTGPKGGQGAKFQRALVSEIIGVGIEFGRKTASRIDPAGVELNAGPVYAAEDPEEEWTINEQEARREKDKPVLFSRKKGEKPGRPSNINHGNVKPTIESEAGGVTLDYAEQITVLSLPALRRLRFPKTVAEEPVAPERRSEIELRARAAVAALGLAAVSLQRTQGYDLRSRCAFVPEGALSFELLGRDGGVKGHYTLEPEDAIKLVQEASEAARNVGMGWPTQAVDLKPAPKLVALLRRSREVAAQGEAEGGG
jgi:CRISPR-associated protein Csb1